MFSGIRVHVPAGTAEQDPVSKQEMRSQLERWPVVRAPGTLAKELGSSPSTHRAAHNCL